MLSDTEIDKLARLMFDWRDIETASHDGTQILAFARGPNGPADTYYGVAQWAEANPDLPNTVSGWFWPFAIRPTHWMPLPDPQDILVARGKVLLKIQLGTEALIKSLGWGEMGRVRAERAVVAVLMAVAEKRG